MQMLGLSDPQDGVGRCSECAKSEYDADRNQTFPNADSLLAHIATTHIHWHPFECVLCPMMFLPTEGVLKQHYERAHPEKVPKAIYTYMEEKKADIMRIFRESQRFLDGNIMHNPEANLNQENKPTTIQDNKVAKEQPKNSHKEPQEIIISDTEEEDEIAMEIEQEERLNMKRLANSERDIFNRLQTGEDADAHALISEEDQGVNSNQAPSNNSLEEGESEEKVWETEKGKDNVSVTNKRKLIKQNLMRAKRVFPCNLCKDKTTTVKQMQKGRHIWNHHMGNNQRFRCNICDYKTSATSKMVDHSQYKHKRLSETNWTDHTTELKTEYNQRYVAAFGAMKPGRRLLPLAEVQYATAQIHDFDCNLCNRSVATTHRANHIWGTHMKAKRYACLYCDYGSVQLKNAKKHATKKHGNLDGKPCWKDNILSMSEEFKKLFDAAFHKRRDSARKYF